MTFSYDRPMMVKFKEFGKEEESWVGGIAYHNEIICGECGMIIPAGNIAQLLVLSWVDISEEILGDEAFD